MNFEEMAQNISKSDMDINLKIAEILKLRNETEKKINLTSNAIVICFIMGILIFPLILMVAHKKNLKILKKELKGIDSILCALRNLESQASV
nr:MAG: hypothetical protein [Bacteriophage sp.]